MEQRTSICKSLIDPRSGFNRASRTFHSLKPQLTLPRPSAAVSAADYILFLRRNSQFPDSSTAIIDSITGRRLSYAELLHRARTLAANLAAVLKLSKGDTALVLSPNLIEVPILCFALLSLGVVVSPVNPLSTRSDLTRFFNINAFTVIFAVSSVVEKTREFHVKTVLLDSAEFDSLTKTKPPTTNPSQLARVTQSDVAAILYSSGTTGNVKGVVLTHRNLTAIAAGYDTVRENRNDAAVVLYTVPFFHVYGFTFCLGAMVLSETIVLMERFSLTAMLDAVQRFRVTLVMVVPALVVALTKDCVTDGYDLRSLEGIVCGGSPLRKENDEAFKAKFPNVLVMQVCIPKP
ncbi:hypothetical protein VNO78_33528 [Psophocarpus tetragonolobus]|uniref:AMP-dependent synthetase/ligase domain-containing protein n=1 Tax=Psophocarpus tetragonolobus TaxID=3891 RepID=A0AAN9RLF1_PSOTE